MLIQSRDPLLGRMSPLPLIRTRNRCGSLIETLVVPSNRRLSKSYYAPVKVKPQEADFLRRMCTGVRKGLTRTNAFKIKLSNSVAINPEHLGFLRLQFNGIDIGH